MKNIIKKFSTLSIFSLFLSVAFITTFFVHGQVSPLYVYQDTSLNSPWIDSSWSNTITKNSTEQINSGSSSMKIVNSAWGAFATRNGNWGVVNDISASQYSNFSFAAYGSGQSLNLQIRLSNEHGNSFPDFYVSVPASSWTIVTVPMSSINPGSYPFNAFSISEQSGAAKTFFLDNIQFTSGGGSSDTTAPTVSITAPTGTVSGSSVTVSATANDNVGVAGVQFKLDGTNLGNEDTTSPYSVTWDTTTSTNGTHTLTATARDAAGNTTTSSGVSVTVNNGTTPGDTTAPTVSISSPTGGSTVSGSAVTVSATATDNVGVAGVQFKLDGTNLGTEDTTSPYSISWNSTQTSNGTHTLSATARDAAGNTTTSSSVSVTVNNTTPPPSTSGYWTTVYYPTWAMQPLGTLWNGHPLGEPANEIDWTGVTHIVHFGNGNIDSTTSPYWKPSISPNGTADGEGREWISNKCSGSGCVDYQRILLDTAHSKGIKVAMTIQAVFPNDFNAVVADPVKRQVFVNAVYDYIIAKGYDGVELDVESWAGGATPVVWSDVSAFMALMRQKLDLMSPRGIFLVSPGEFEGAHYTPAMDAYVDQYNIQTYAMNIVWNGCSAGYNAVWFINALYSFIDTPNPGSYREGTGNQCFEGRSVDASKAVSGRGYGIAEWIRQGHNPKKMGIGLAAYSSLFRNNGKAFTSNQLYGSYDAVGNGDYNEALNLLNNGGTMYWDDNRKVSYISGIATKTVGNVWYGEAGVTQGDKYFSSFETPKSLQFKADWIKAQGLGGAMLYSSVSDADPTKPFGQRNPLISALASAMSGGATPTPGDTTAPTVSISSPTGTVSGSSVTVSATATDNVGVSGVQFKLDGTNLGTEDTTSPYSVTWDTTTSTNGTHTLTATARDAAGNTTTSTSVSVTVNNIVPDTTAPTISLTAPTSGSIVSGSAVTVSATATDNVGVAGVQFKLDGTNLGSEDTTSPYSISWNSTQTSNGSHTLTATARDAAGNTTTSTSVSVTVNNIVPDTTAPTVSLSAPANGSTVSGSTVSILATATDNVGVSGVQFKLNGVNLGVEDITSPYSIIWDSTLTTNGSYPLTAVARDAAGNTTTSASITVTVNNNVTPPDPGDTTAPTVSLSAPANGGTVSGSTVGISATATDNVGVVGVQFKLNGVNIGAEDTTSPYSITWNSTSVSNGTYPLTAVARDAAGNMTVSASRLITINNVTADTTAPTVSITAPINNSTVSGSAVNISATASDNIGVASVQFKLNGTSLGQEILKEPFTFVWDTRASNNGTHTLSAVVKDTAGNISTSAPVNVVVNNSNGGGNGGGGGGGGGGSSGGNSGGNSGNGGNSKIDKTPIKSQLDAITPGTDSKKDTSISGCGNRTTGFSSTTGKSCIGNIPTTSTVYNLGTVTLKNGSKGDAVKELQRFLNDKLNLGLVLDGKLGPKTIAVIKKWQKSKGLVPDGLVGAKTKAMMNK